MAKKKKKVKKSPKKSKKIRKKPARKKTSKKPRKKIAARPKKKLKPKPKPRKKPAAKPARKVVQAPKARIEINEDLCKGCGICVDICPRQVFEMSTKMNKSGVYPAKVKRPAQCIICYECEFLCPDMAISVTPES